MAWVEQVTDRSWRVRYAADGRTRSVSGFPTRDQAEHYAATIQEGRRGGSWIDSAAGRMTL